MALQSGQVWIVDCRDGASEKVVALGGSARCARSAAYSRAAAEASARNASEGWARFVALPWGLSVTALW